MRQETIKNLDSGRGSFTEGSLTRHVRRLSGYMILGFLAMTVAQLIEAVYLGVYGKEELAAVAFTFPVVMALSAMTRGLGIGAGAVLARAMGRGDREEAGRLATHGLVLVLVFTITASVFIFLWAQEIFTLLGARGVVLDRVLNYVQVWCIGFPAFGVAMIGSLMMRSFGDPAYPGMVMTLGSILQVILGPLFIFGFMGIDELGIAGAAWAFVIARSGSFAMTLYWFALKERIVRIEAARFFESCKAILHVGLPATATNLVGPVAAAVSTRLLSDFGTTVIAGFGVASRIEAVVSMVVIGISASTGPLVGQNWGARLYDRVEEAIRICIRYCMAWSLAAALIMWGGAEFFITLVNEDPSLRETALRFLYIVPITIGFMGMASVATSTFNALSRPIPPLVLSIGQLVILYVPAAMAGLHFWGYTGIFFAMGFANVASGIMGWFWSRRMLNRAKLETQ